MASSSHQGPGEKGSIVAKMNTQGRRGKVTKLIIVYTNDPQRPEIRLTLTAEVKPKVPEPAKDIKPLPPAKEPD